MEITIDLEYLQNKISLVKGITRHKSLLPITNNVMIDFETKKISATDLEVSAITGLVNTTEEAGRFLVHAGTLSEILGNLAAQDVRFVCNETGVLRIEQDRMEIGLSLADPDEFPNIEVLNDTEAFSITGKDIIRGISKVLYAVSTDAGRQILNGVLMQVKSGEFRMCATDGFRIALLKKEVRDIANTPQIVIPGKNIKLLKEVLDENTIVGVVIAENMVQFMTPAVTMIFRTLQEAYPDYDSVLASTDGFNIAFAKRVPFLECLRRMAPIATKNDPIRLARTFDGGLLVRIESDRGYAQETIDCEFNNEAEFDFTFNLKFLLDAVEHIENDQLVIRYPNSYGVVVFDALDYICGVMPIRTEKTPIEKQADKKGKAGSEGDHD